MRHAKPQTIPKQNATSPNNKKQKNQNKPKITKPKNKSSKIIINNQKKHDNQQQQQQQQQKNTIDNMANNTNPKPKNKKDSKDDWILKLVQQTTTSASSTKEERIQKRLQQKQRREETKQHRNINNLKQNESNNEKNKTVMIQVKNTFNDIPLKLSDASYNNLSTINSALGSTILSTENDDSIDTKRKPLYKPIKEPRGKAMKNSSYQSNAKNELLLQPRQKDYNGLGLARPSLYLHFHDGSFRAKLIDEFYDHVDGFNGKFHKKKDDDTMLWKKLLMQKKKNES